MDKVSIIIPVYNAESDLEKCLDTLINQTYKNIELIIIDDGSKDNSKDIIKQYTERYNNIISCTQSNNGVSRARNKGLDIATGEYIVFVDSDDWVAPNYIEEMLEVANDIDFTYCDWVIEYENSSVIDSLSKYGFTYSSDAKELLEFYIVNRIGCAPWGKLFKRSIIEEKKIRFCEKLPIAEDYLFILEYIINSRTIKNIALPLVHYNCTKIGANYKIRSNYIDLQFIILDEMRLIINQISRELSVNNKFEIAKLKVYCDMILYLKNIYTSKNKCKDDIGIIANKIKLECNSTLISASDINFKEKFIAFLVYKNCLNIIFIITKIRALTTKIKRL